jgi:hypothetical protein
LFFFSGKSEGDRSTRKGPRLASELPQEGIVIINVKQRHQQFNLALDPFAFPVEKQLRLDSEQQFNNNHNNDNRHGRRFLVPE